MAEETKPEETPKETPKEAEAEKEETKEAEGEKEKTEEAEKVENGDAVTESNGKAEEQGGKAVCIFLLSAQWFSGYHFCSMLNGVLIKPRVETLLLNLEKKIVFVCSEVIGGGHFSFVSCHLSIFFMFLVLFF